MEKRTDKEIEQILNPANKSEPWPEFEIIKDDVIEFMSDLPIEVYEHLFRAVHRDKENLTTHLLGFVEQTDKIKKCFNYCPKCDAGENDIEWGEKDWDEGACQNATCKKCGCEFYEIYEYVYSLIEEN